MQLRKRFVKPDKKINLVSEPEDILIDSQPDQDPDEVEAEAEVGDPPLFQPRREKHTKKKGLTVSVFFAAFLSIILFVGWGAGWMKHEQEKTVASTNAPITVEPPVAEEQMEKVAAPAPNESKPVEQPKVSVPAQQPKPQNNSKPPEVQKPVNKQIMKHKVQPGETLYRISIKYYHTGKYADYLTRYNGLGSPSQLVSGTYIRVPYPPN